LYRPGSSRSLGFPIFSFSSLTLLTVRVGPRCQEQALATPDLNKIHFYKIQPPPSIRADRCRSISHNSTSRLDQCAPPGARALGAHKCTMYGARAPAVPASWPSRRPGGAPCAGGRSPSRTAWLPPRSAAAGDVLRELRSSMF
jgi:hypothetical protein